MFSTTRVIGRSSVLAALAIVCASALMVVETASAATQQCRWSEWRTFRPAGPDNDLQIRGQTCVIGWPSGEYYNGYPTYKAWIHVQWRPLGSYRAIRAKRFDGFNVQVALEHNDKLMAYGYAPGALDAAINGQVSGTWTTETGVEMDLDKLRGAWSGDGDILYDLPNSTWSGWRLHGSPTVNVR